MTPAQFKAALKKLDATPSSKKAAAMLGLSLRQVQRFASGENAIPGPVEKLLKCLLEAEKAKG